MKVNVPRGFYVALSVCAVAAIILLSYLLVSARDVPECSANLRTSRVMPAGMVESNIYVNIVRSGWNRATIALNGRAYRDGKKQVIARILEGKYKYNRGYYYITIEKSIRQPMDNFSSEDAQAFFLGVNKQYYALKIAKLDDDNFIMYYGKLPELLCSVTRK
ncbi:hypothetical protein ABM430_002961 [Serratia marcescens]